MSGGERASGSNRDAMRRRHITKMRDVRGRAETRGRRERNKRSRAAKRRRRRSDAKRDKRVTELYGKEGHNSCGRKIRYTRLDVAQRFATMLAINSGKDIRVYSCSLCGGWHITSHPYVGTPTERSHVLKPSEIFIRARDAAMRVRQIDVERTALWDRIGVQGYSIGRHSHTSILDPSRKIDTYIDETAELDLEKVECQKDVTAAWSLVNGLERYSQWGSESAQLVAEYYIFAKSLVEVARSTGYDAKVVEKALKAFLDEADEIGIARLKGAVGADYYRTEDGDL